MCSSDLTARLVDQDELALGAPGAITGLGEQGGGGLGQGALIGHSDAQHNTLIFDEIDVGISGATANVVGKLLRKLSEKCQVILLFRSSIHSVMS